MTSAEALAATVALLARIADTVPVGTPLPAEFDRVYDQGCAALARVADA